MSSLPWFRAARRLVGLSKQQEWPYLEALMEAEEGQPENDYLLASRIAPAVCAVVAAFTLRMVFLHNNSAFLIGTSITTAIAALLWFIFQKVDKAISPARKQIRKQARVLWQRYRGIKNLLGVEEALSRPVGEVLNSAAGIYLKHVKPVNYFGRKDTNSAIGRSEQAIEGAMARMLDLAIPETAAAQEIELSRGWAMGLLKEMRALDATIERQKQSPELSYSDPLLNLREARMELEMREEASHELNQLDAH